MATGTFYIRPSADISLGHPVYPDTLTAGYLAISEEVSDGTTTYIGATSNPGGSKLTYNSRFRMSFLDNVKITKVNSATLGFDGYLKSADQGDESSCACVITVSGETVFSDTHSLYNESTSAKSSYVDFTGSDIPSLVTAINNYIGANGNAQLPEIFVDIENVCDLDNGTKATSSSYVTQVYIAVECEYESDIGIHRKVNGAWMAANAAYRKVNGAWEEITADECRSFILNQHICK